MKPFREAKLTIVTPVYRNDATIGELSRRVFAASEPLFAAVEHIFVNDGSPDGARRKLKELCHSDGRIKAINLARNFGQHVALMTGLRHASGDYILLIDGDLEEAPEDLPSFMKKMEEGYEIVVGLRNNRRRSKIRSLLSRFYSAIFNRLSDYKLIDNASTMRLMTARFAGYLTSFTESPFIPGITAWIGLPIGLVPLEMHERPGSSYTLGRLLNHARTGILGFSNKPIRLATLSGLGICLASILYGLWVMARYFLIGDVAPGFTSIVALFTFLMGAQFVFIGVLGEYIGEIFISAKNRPSHLIYDRFGFEERVPARMGGGLLPQQFDDGLNHEINPLFESQPKRKSDDS